MQIQNQTRVVEFQGIIVNVRFKIEKALKQRKAFMTKQGLEKQILDFCAS
jgi:hypothetical protein